MTAWVDHVALVVQRQLDAAAGGRPIDWGKRGRETELTEAVWMAHGALLEVGRRASEIVLVEAPFRARIDCGAKEPFWLQGTIDVIYRDHDAHQRAAQPQPDAGDEERRGSV